MQVPLHLLASGKGFFGQAASSDEKQVYFSEFCSVENTTRCMSCVRSGLQKSCFEFAAVPERCCHSRFVLSPQSFLLLGLCFPLYQKLWFATALSLTIVSEQLPAGNPSSWFLELHFSEVFCLDCIISFLIFVGAVHSNPSDAANTIDASTMVLRKGKAWRGLTLARGQLQQCWWCLGVSPCRRTPSADAVVVWRGGLGLESLDWSVAAFCQSCIQQKTLLMEFMQPGLCNGKCATP